jgi:threonine dehydratase
LLRAAEIIRSGAARILRLSEFEIAAAMRIYYADTHNVTEGAGRHRWPASSASASVVRAKAPP